MFRSVAVMSFSRRQTLAGLAATAAMPLLSGCARQMRAGMPILPDPPTAPPLPAVTSEAAAKAMLDSFGHNLLALSPESATSLGLDIGQRAWMRTRLTDRSIAGQKKVADVIAADLARAEAVDTAALSFSTRTSVETVKSAYRTALQGFAFPYGDVAVGGYRNSPYVVIQNVGAYLDTPNFLDADVPVDNASDAEAYLTRLEQLPAVLDGELERLQAARALGLVPPSFLADKTIAQLTISANNAAKGGGSMASSLAQKTKAKAIPGDWEARAAKIVTGSIVPALQRQIAELQAERALATGLAGISSRPRGEEYYRYALKASTTTDTPPDEIHRIGLQQVAELQGRMDPILKSLGYTQGSVGARMQGLAKDPRFKFSDGDKGRAEIIAYINQRLQIIRDKVIPRTFNTVVPGHLEVRRMSPEQEPGAPGAYGGAGSIDGKIPGKFWINLRSTDLHSKYSLPDLAAHEAIPGHVWQGEYANKLPLIRTLLAFNAYSEGWALYAEQLVDEMGVYDDFPVGRLGYLQSIAFRACRLVVDTGLHAKGWTREQGVDYFVRVNGSNPLEVASELDRYCAWPGQACGYKVGQNQINRLRDKAIADLGPRYDLRAFDDAVVLGGNVPLDVLALNVEDYVARTKAAA
ncbi:MAG: DUF885 domain-containing protein [Sphingomonas sp.]|nr:DUF885 domain-containing protein [Sphingomonas sp.]